MNDIVMPSTFPAEFREFGLATRPFFPKCLSVEDQNDPLRRRLHFDWSWQAVRYRYRLCAECNEKFKSLWKVEWENQELTYKLERCIYMFFMGGLSVFDKFRLLSLFPRARYTAWHVSRGGQSKKYHPEDYKQGFQLRVSAGGNSGAARGPAERAQHHL